MTHPLIRIVQAYALDPRSLALMRILVGLGFVVTRIINLPWVREFYTDQGSYPRYGAIFFPNLYPTFPQGASVFNAVGHPAGVFLLYFLAIAAGLAVAVGYKTRPATVCCWVLGFSLYNRCPIINPASDAEVLLCLFFGIFLPWGDMWSVDNPPSRSSEPELKPYNSAATLGWRIQVSALYLTAALSKTSFHWGNGSASLVAMKSDSWSSWIGRWVASLLEPHPELGRDLTNYVVLLEFILPFLLLTPVVRLQFLGVIGLVVMHATFGMCLHLEAFTPLAIVCLSGFIPSLAWNYLGWLQRSLNRFCLRWFNRAGREENGARFSPLGPLASAFLTWAVLGIVWSCALSTRSCPIPLTQRALEPWHAFGLQESWGMFVPPPYQGGWFVFRGKTMRGEWVNMLIQGQPADSLSLPEHIDQTLPTSRHVLLYNTVVVKSKPLAAVQERIAEDFRLRWESSHPDPLDRLQELEIYRFYREYDSDRGTISTPELKYSYKKNVS